MNPVDNPEVQLPEADLGEQFDDTLMNPVETKTGVYQAQFESIRQIVFQDVQEQAAKFCMNIQELVHNTIAGNIEMTKLARLHAGHIAKKLQSSDAQLVSATLQAAMFRLQDKMLYVTYDLSNASATILTAKHMQPVQFNNVYDAVSESLLAKQIQVLMVEPISDELVIPYEQNCNKLSMTRQQLVTNQRLLRDTILSRAFTAFDFQIGLSFYTVNYADDMSMLFWDRYTITDMTAKSYYVEQHCIIEHIANGAVEPERFIALHRPSKNSMAAFLAARLAALTELVRPQPTDPILLNTKVETPVVEYESEITEDNDATDETQQ